MRHSVATAASLLTLGPAVLAVGTAVVVNNCGSDVYYASVGQSAHADMAKLPNAGYSEGFSKPGVGISIKLSPSTSGAVTQFEYIWVEGQNVAYDISNIDGNPFSSGGMSLVPSMEGADGFLSCVTVNCPAGQDRCDAAYNLPDDVRTKVCPEDSDLTFTLCPGGASAGGTQPVESAAPAEGSSGQVASPAQATSLAVQSSPTTSSAKASRTGNAAGSAMAKPAATATGRHRPHQGRAHSRQLV